MEIWTLIIVSFVPGLLWVWFFYRQDRYDKEPPFLIFWTFLLGLIAVVPAALIELPFGPLIADPPNMFIRFLTAFLVIGLVEEGFKLLAVYVAVFRRPEFNEPIDGIIYGVTASLGFAALENLFYTAAFGLAIAPIRAVVTSLAHASFGGISGLYLGMALLQPQYGFRTVLKGLAIAALLHGAYDFFIMARLVHPLFAVAFIVVIYRYLAGVIRKLNAESPFR